MEQERNARTGRLTLRRRELVCTLAAGMMAWPLMARAQQPGRAYRIAMVHPTNPVEIQNEVALPRFIGPFIAELRRLGYTEGQNLVIDRYSGGGKVEHYAELVKTIVAARPEVVLSLGDVLAPLFKAATATLPIVVTAGDTTITSLVPNFAHPGGNITGVSVDAGGEIEGKRLTLLLQAVPTARRIAYLTPRDAWDSPVRDPPRAAREAARLSGVSLIPALLDTPANEAEYRRAFMQIARDSVDALLVGAGAEHFPNAKLIAELAVSARLPTFYMDRDFVDQGGMISYGMDFPELFRHAGNDVGQILNGAKPGDIPIYRSTRYELVINLKTAKALGIEIPTVLQAGADVLID